jgi:hypothetical protein
MHSLADALGRPPSRGHLTCGATASGNPNRSTCLLLRPPLQSSVNQLIGDYQGFPVEPAGIEPATSCLQSVRSGLSLFAVVCRRQETRRCRAPMFADVCRCLPLFSTSACSLLSPSVRTDSKPGRGKSMDVVLCSCWRSTVVVGTPASSGPWSFRETVTPRLEPTRDTPGLLASVETLRLNHRLQAEARRRVPVTQPGLDAGGIQARVNYLTG